MRRVAMDAWLPRRITGRAGGTESRFRTTLCRKILPAALIVLALAGGARAEQHRIVLHGLFCNTRADLEQTLDYMRMNLAPQVAVALTNGEGVACVYADKVQYVVTAPIVLGETRRDSGLISYQATLVAVLVGGNVRPVEPPAVIFLATPEWLTGATARGGA